VHTLPLRRRVTNREPEEGPFSRRPAEEAFRRRASDWLRLVVGALLLAVLAVRAARIETFEISIEELFAALPRGLSPLVRGLGGLGALWALALVVGAALVGRRWRLARDLLLAGVLAWAAARVLGSDVIGHLGLRASLRTLTHVGSTPSFPYVRLSVLMAVVSTAGPYLARPARRLGQAIVVVVAVSAMYLGSAFPDDVAGGLALGWCVGAFIHLVFGSPGGRPTVRQVEAALAEIGLEATWVHLAVDQDADASVFTCHAPDGPLWVKVIGRDELDAQLIAKAWRFAAYKQRPPPLHLSRVHQVEHEACMALLARSVGVDVPEVLFVGRAGPGAALLVMRAVAGVRLSDLSADQLTDELLEAAWTQVAKLHKGRVAHGTLDTTHLVDYDRRVAVVGFSRASTTGYRHRRDRDVAELLASTAAVVGDERAATSAVRVLGGAAVAEALPFLQPAALRREARQPLGGPREVRRRLDELRAVAAGVAGVAAPELPQLQRFRPASVLLAVSSLFAIVALLDQVGTPSHVLTELRHAGWQWLAVALLASLATNLPYAVALMGTVPLRLPLWPTSELQLAMSYSNLVIPVVGGTGFQVRFLQRQGSEWAEAVTAGGLLSTVGTVIVQLPLFVVALSLSPSSLALGNISVTGILRYALFAVLGLGVLAAVGFGIPRLRRAVLGPAREALSTIVTVVRTPRQVALIVGGNVAVSTLYTGCLMSCLLAFGASLSFWTALAMSIGVGTLGALVPVPGGGATVGSLGLAGALSAIGVPTQVAVAATLANGLAVTYLPAVPGWFATRHLLRADYL
jgi:tRNA A-37 threonylcarbamoyl transferase component Bud32/uncharacterized membrane protein YbhN (UPF0104 family)